MFDDPTLRAVERFAKRMKVDTAALLAVAEIESAGKVFATVSGRQEPLIRWEGHYFDQRLKEPQRSKARAAGLANPKAGAVKNPASQQARWDKLFRPAALISGLAAFESTSWGLGQVMGAHWKKLGFRSHTEMLAVARSGAAGQIELMCLYIEKFGLVDELQRLDFTAFTRGYNGPGGIKAGYHTKMARAYQKYSGKAPVSKATGMLRMGSKGARVRELQALLVRDGYNIKVDGDYGPSTRDAVKAFQAVNGLDVDGVAGPKTLAALSALKVAPEETPGEISALEVPEVKDAAKGFAPVAVIMTVRDQVAQLAYNLFGIESETAQMVANALLTGAGVIGTGLALYALYGWWKNGRTDEGDVVL